MIYKIMKIGLFFVLTTFLFLFCTEKTEHDNLDELLNSEIENAKLTDFEGFYFVGNNKGFPSVFWYDFKDDKTKLFWHENKERVINLLISPDYKSGYFITKRKQRLKSSKPAIERGKLYRIDFEQKKVESISQLEDGIQVIPFWTDNDRFTLIVNSIDKTIASYVNKNTQVYNRFGKLLSDNTEIFDLTKDGYPVTQLPEINYNSPNELFIIIERNDSIVINQTKSNIEIQTELVNKQLLQISWAENKKYVLMLITTLTDNEEETQKSELIIFDIQLKKSVKSFSGVRYKRFVLMGDFLIFDKGIGRNSQIEILKLESFSNYKTIKISGGCSLRNISG